MEDIKEYLRTGKRCLTPEMLNTLRAYDFVVYNGRQFRTKNLMEEMRGCEHCCRLLLRVCSLEARLEKYENPKPVVDLEIVLADFFETNYKRVSGRSYSRRTLFKEVKEFLDDEFEICLLNPSDVRYKRFNERLLKIVVKGTKGYELQRRIICRCKICRCNGCV